MVNRQARLVENLFLPVSLFVLFVLKYEDIIWPVRYCFIVNSSTILVGQARSSGPPRWVRERWEPTLRPNAGSILRLKGAMIC